MEGMSITLPLKKMSAEEKIQVMESIWVDLCDTAGSTLSPDWHGKVLADRKAAALAGEEEIIDWETAKQKILENLQ
jgi:hypothetical protein